MHLCSLGVSFTSQTTEINFASNFLGNSVSNTLFDTLCSYIYLLIYVMVPREKGKQVSMAYFGSLNKRNPEISAPFSSPEPHCLLLNHTYSTVLALCIIWLWSLSL